MFLTLHSCINEVNDDFKIIEMVKNSRVYFYFYFLPDFQVFLFIEKFISLDEKKHLLDSIMHLYN